MIQFALMGTDIYFQCTFEMRCRKREGGSKNI